MQRASWQIRSPRSPQTPYAFFEVRALTLCRLWLENFCRRGRLGISGLAGELPHILDLRLIAQVLDFLGEAVADQPIEQESLDARRRRRRIDGRGTHGYHADHVRAARSLEDSH